MKPSRAIVLMVSRSDPNTMALGGVATGNMKAKLQLIVAGTMISFGSISAASAAAARIGISSVAVAVLLVTSVKNVTTKQSTTIMTTTGTNVSDERLVPTESLNPDALKAFAIAIPPP